MEPNQYDTTIAAPVPSLKGYCSSFGCLICLSLRVLHFCLFFVCLLLLPVYGCLSLRVLQGYCFFVCCCLCIGVCLSMHCRARRPEVDGQKAEEAKCRAAWSRKGDHVDTRKSTVAERQNVERDFMTRDCDSLYSQLPVFENPQLEWVRCDNNRTRFYRASVSQNGCGCVVTLALHQLVLPSGFLFESSRPRQGWSARFQYFLLLPETLFFFFFF